MEHRVSAARPEFATNRSTEDGEETVAAAVLGLLQGLRETWKEPPALAIASAYFNVGGFTLLAPELEQTGPVRLLLGADPTDAALRTTLRPLQARSRRKGVDPTLPPALEHHETALREDRDLLGFTREADAESQRLLAWLRDHDVEVRRLTHDFLHGKAFVVETNTDAVLAGSSNFTYAGLARNHELNLGLYTPRTVAQVLDWYDGLWDKAAAFDLAAFYESRWEPHQPIDVFLRMLHERYGDTLEEDTAVRSELGLTQFQQDGVWRAKRILDRRKGVVIADEVGLGKTFLAGELIREAVIGRRQKVLVICPATLRDSTWRPFLRERALAADVVSYEELVRDLDEAGRGGSALQGLDDYAMVVIDEAHHLRNAATQRAEAMRLLLGGRVPKDLVLLTATPVNNSLVDLHTLISYITPADGAFADIGVPSLEVYFRDAMAQAPEDLSPKHLFAVLDAIAVRRTRRFVKKYYARERITIAGVEQPITFPTPTVHRVDYRLDDVLPGFFQRLATALGAEADDRAFEDTGVILGEEGRVLTMARYVPSRFERGAQTAQYQRQNAGLLRSALLKRFESSAAAFASTVQVMLFSHDQFLAALDQGWVLTGDALRAWASSDSDDVDAIVRSGLEQEKISSDNAQLADRYELDVLRESVVADRELLRSLGAEVAGVHWRDDPKVTALADELAHIAALARADGIGEQDQRNRRKVLLFTYFADTARYLNEALVELCAEDPRLSDYADRTVVVVGGARTERQDAILGFAPLTAGGTPDTDPASDRYDLAISTDVLSEGVNLQQARNIVNYDLPWNPMRLVQRHGRVDRIGSPHDRIELRCFFPDAELETLLGLEARLQHKLHQAAAAFGAGEVLPGVSAVERTMTETREEIDRLRAEDATLFEDGGSAAASGEEFRRRLADAFRSQETKQRVLAIPWGGGTGMVRAGAEPGVVFCARIGDHPQPELRYVPLTSDLRPQQEGGASVVVRDVLACLDHADPRLDSVPATMSDGLRDAALDAWQVALTDIDDQWMLRTDPRNVEPSVPAVMRRAAQMVRDHGKALGDRQPDVIARLQQRVDQRVQRQVRQIVRDFENHAAEGAVALGVAVDDLRLPRPEPVQPLPPIERDRDIHLVCWVAIVPEAPAE